MHNPMYWFKLIRNMLQFLTIHIFLLAIFWKLPFSSCEDVVISIEQGQLRGTEKYTDFGQKYYSFIGIPYAKPPVGPLRFKAPQPVESWDGIYDALQLRPNCVNEEDCLYINVMTPRVSTSEPLLHTMVYIHGGSFIGGSGDPYTETVDYYTQNDIVFVSINYRLGPLGFLSTGDSVVPGNNGLKDQTLALRWVQQNIAQFGGDPNSVTISGMSAGGASIHYQVLSPMTKGLFHGAIAQSGSALNPWAFEDTSSARSRTLRYGQALGANTTDSHELIDFLRTLSFKELLDGVGKAQTELEKSHAISFFTPTVEEPSESGEENFLPEHPLNIMAKGTFNHVPFMTGTVSQEGMINLLEVYLNQEKLEYYNNNFDLILPEDLIVDKNTSLQIAEKVKKFYFNDKGLSQRTLVQYVNLIGDTQFLYGVNIHSRLIGAVSTASTYHYFFKYPGRLGSYLRVTGDYFPGIQHSEEDGYTFYFGTPPNTDGGPENEMTQWMVALWTNFVKTRNPTPEPDPLLQNLTWSPVTELDHFYLEIEKDLIIRRDVLNNRMAFWNDIYSGVSYCQN